MTNDVIKGSVTKIRPDAWASLAGLRFFLACIVLTEHMLAWGNLPPALGRLTEFGGRAAVLMFLVVSGFSIAHSIETQPQRFYERRVIRIYPLYFLSLLICLAPFAIGRGPVIAAENGTIAAPESLWQLLGNFALLQGIAVKAMNGPAWSLSVECVFYALTPLLQKLKTKYLLAAMLLSAAWGARIGSDQTPIHGLYGQAVGTVGWAWLLGFLFYRHRTERWCQNLLFCTGISVMCFYQDPVCKLQWLTWALGTSLFVSLGGLVIRSERVKSFLTYLGELSYPVYILHIPLIWLVESDAKHHSWEIYLLTVFAGSIAAYHLLDKPYRRYASARLRTKIIANLPIVHRSPPVQEETPTIIHV